MRDVYDEEMKGLHFKMKSYRLELQRNVKERRGEKVRKREVLIKNVEAERQMDYENLKLADEIEEVDLFIEKERVINIIMQVKLANQKREKSRLLR